MSLRRPAIAPPYPERTLRTRALERAYPLAKQLAEVLELEAIEPMATSARHIRQAIGAQLAEIGATGGKGDIVADGAPCQPFTEPVDMAERTDPLDPAEEAALLRQALRREDEGPEVADGR